MPVVLVATKNSRVAGEAKVEWLVEDIWFYENGDAELQLECIIRSKEEMRELTILMSCFVDSIEDLSHLYLDSSYQNGYPKCWPDIYSRFETNMAESTVTVNDVKAKVGKVEASLAFRTSDFTEIKLKFDPAIKSESRIFRLGLCCKGIITTRGLASPITEKRLKFYAYGMAPFSGSLVESLLKERKIEAGNWLRLRHHVIYAKWSKKNLVIAGCTFPPTRSYPFGECEALPRYCPPLERIARRTKKETSELKKKESYCMLWEFENLLPTKGQLVVVDYFTSTIQEWLSENWLELVAFLLAIVSILLTLLKPF